MIVCRTICMWGRQQECGAKQCLWKPVMTYMVFAIFAALWHDQLQTRWVTLGRNIEYVFICSFYNHCQTGWQLKGKRIIYASISSACLWKSYTHRTRMYWYCHMIKPEYRSFCRAAIWFSTYHSPSWRNENVIYSLCTLPNLLAGWGLLSEIKHTGNWIIFNYSLTTILIILPHNSSDVFTRAQNIPCSYAHSFMGRDNRLNICGTNI